MSQPIHIVATLNAKQGQEAAVLAALTAVVPVVRKLPGCLRYDLHRDADATGQFVMLESWSDASALEAHLQGKTFTDLAAQFESLLAAHPEINRLTQIA